MPAPQGPASATRGRLPGACPTGAPHHPSLTAPGGPGHSSGPPAGEKTADRGPGKGRLLLLALGLVGDLGELGLCWSGAVGPCA